MAKPRKWNLKRRPWVVVPDPGAYPDVGSAVVLVAGEWITPGRAVEAVPHATSLYLDGHRPVIEVGRTRYGSASEWVGEEATAEQAARALRYVQEAVRAAWRAPGVSLAGSPATTGRDLWLRTIREPVPVMTETAQGFVRGISPQGRIETFPYPSPLVPRVVEVDLRLAYAWAMLGDLPVGQPRVIEARDRRPYDPAKVRAAVTVPDGWRFPGLLPRPLEGGGWDWPRSPGMTWESWFDGGELHLALEYGWHVQETGPAVVWPRWGRPLRLLTSRLLAVIEEAPEDLAPFVRKACRAVILYGLGAMHGTPHRTSAVGNPGDVPLDAIVTAALPDGRVSWYTETAPAWPEAVHPEWTSAVWAKVRARLARGFLQAPPGTALGCRTDALYLDHRPEWPDDGRPGSWVVKADTGPVEQPAPRTQTELLAARDRRAA